MRESLQYLFHVFAVTLSKLVRSVHVVCIKAERLIIAHQVVVMVWHAEQVWVYQKPHVVSVEGGEHLADSWDSDLALVKHVLFFSEENTVGDGGVGVCVRLVVQADHVAFGDEVEEHGGEEGEEANDSTESDLHREALDS